MRIPRRYRFRHRLPAYPRSGAGTYAPLVALVVNSVFLRHHRDSRRRHTPTLVAYSPAVVRQYRVQGACPLVPLRQGFGRHAFAEGRLRLAGHSRFRLNSEVACHPKPWRRVVRPAGVEPAWDCSRRILSPQRLPISPRAHSKAGAGLCPICLAASKPSSTT